MPTLLSVLVALLITNIVSIVLSVYVFVQHKYMMKKIDLVGMATASLVLRAKCSECDSRECEGDAKTCKELRGYFEKEN